VRVVLWLRMPSKTVHHTDHLGSAWQWEDTRHAAAKVIGQEPFAGLNGLTADRRPVGFGAGLTLT